MPSRMDWARAYLRQAEADWKLFLELQRRADVPRCQSLHYLQMATEKLAKAYRFRDTTTPVEALLTSHVGFPRFLNTFLLSPQMKEEYRGRAAHLESVRKDCERLARAVERLAPAVDRDSNPGNVEYPWAIDDESVIAPVDYSFPELSLLWGGRGRVFLNFVRRALSDFNAAISQLEQ